MKSKYRTICLFLQFVGPAVLFTLTGGCGLTGNAGSGGEEAVAPDSPVSVEPLPECTGGLTITAAGQVITADDVVGPLAEALGPDFSAGSFQQFRLLARPEVAAMVRTKIAEQILYKKALAKLGDDVEDSLEQAVEKEVRSFVAGFGGNYALAEDRLRRMGLDWESFRREKKKQLVSQWYLGTQLKEDRPLTHGDLLEYYNRVKEDRYAVPGRLQFRLIDIQPEKLALDDPNRSPEDAAKELASELIDRIKAGENFAGLAREYSHGHRAAEGGLWKPLKPGSLAEPYDVIESVCEHLKPGEISGPIEAGGHIFIVQLEDKQTAGYVPFEQVQHQIEQQLTVSRRNRQINEYLSELAPDIAGATVSAFVDHCTELLYQRITGE